MRKIILTILLICPWLIQAQTSSDIQKIPNVFSPNGDGVNDQFTVLFDNTIQVQYLQITFYNRYGQIVHEREIPETALKDNPLTTFYLWDGMTNAGLPVPEGTYYFVLQYKTGNASQEHTGTVTVLR